MDAMFKSTQSHLSTRIQKTVWYLHKEDKMPLLEIAKSCEATLNEVIAILAVNSGLTTCEAYAFLALLSTSSQEIAKVLPQKQSELQTFYPKFEIEEWDETIKGSLSSMSAGIRRTIWYLHKEDSMPFLDIARTCLSSLDEVVEVLADRSGLTISETHTALALLYEEKSTDEILKEFPQRQRQIKAFLPGFAVDEKAQGQEETTTIGFEEEFEVHSGHKGTSCQVTQRKPLRSSNYSQAAPVNFELDSEEVVVSPSKVYTEEQLAEFRAREASLAENVLKPEVKKNLELAGSFDFDDSGLPLTSPRETPLGVYFGEKRESEIEGRGKFYFNDGSYAEGYWVNGKLNGRGGYFSSNGHYYIGGWTEGKKHGEGKIVSQDMIYEGEFEEDVRQGEGTETWRSGLTYGGEFKKNSKWGNGRLKLTNGDCYEGQFKLSQFEGNGTYTWVNGNQYVGTFCRSQMQGKGVFRWPTGQVYEGEFSSGLRQGHGKMTYEDGSVYEGSWLKGDRHGEGCIYVPGEEPRNVVFVEGREISSA
jgi:hypothetical protein